MDATRICRGCEQEAPMASFVDTGGPGWFCKPCRHAKTAAHNRKKRATPEGREQYRQYQREAAARRYQKVKAVLAELKKNPCTDCGGTFPPICMEFDHRDGRGTRITVGQASGGSLATLLAEVAVCDLVCANCHALRTEAQRLRGDWKPSGRRRKPALF